VKVENGLLVLESGYMTGIHWTNDVPKTNYELSLEARRMSGNDFFCGLTFPIAGTNVSLIVGGWGGGLVGISSIDGMELPALNAFPDTPSRSRSRVTTRKVGVRDVRRNVGRSVGVS